jgi:hypothetical protein
MDGLHRCEKSVKVTVNEDAETLGRSVVLLFNHAPPTTPAVFELDACVQFKLRGVRKD